MKKAFTLVEMVVVITIMAVLTHLAVREVGSFRDQKMFAAANRQLSEINDAVKAFVADMGRLPTELKELWELPDGARRGGLIDAFSVDSKLNESNRVVIAGGWKGPYLKLPVERRRLREQMELYDPWGNNITSKYDNGIVAVGHYGANGREDSKDAIGYERDVWVRFDGKEGFEDYRGCELSVRVNYTEGVDFGSVGEDDKFKLFSSSEHGIFAITNECSPLLRQTEFITFRGLTPGEKWFWEPVTKKAYLIAVGPYGKSVQIDVR